MVWGAGVGDMPIKKMMFVPAPPLSLEDDQTPAVGALPLVWRGADADGPARVCVVAEVGVNHDGEVGRAEALIDAAAQAGADAVKLQYFRPARLLSNQAELAGYQRGKASSQRALLAGLALPLETIGRLGERARSAGLGFVVTPFSPGDADDLAGLAPGAGLSAVKTASPDAVNLPLLERVFSLGLPVLLSTGTCTLDELGPAAGMLRAHGAGGVVLHCVSSYPTPPGLAGLGGMAALRDAFGLPVGYSDHTVLTRTGALAAAAGAVVLEKHITHDAAAPGPDHAASLGPRAFAAYVRHVREAEQMLGPTAKRVDPAEHDVRRVSRQSVCVVRDLPAGHVLTAEDLTVKRPGTGVPAAELSSVVGRTLAKAVSGNDLLDAEMLA